MSDWIMRYVLVMPYDAWEPEYGDCEKYDTTFFETPEKMSQPQT